MKAIFINFTDSQGNVTKTFSACSLKTGTMDNIFDIAEKAQVYEDGQMNMGEAKQFFRDLKALIVDVFAGQFTYDELNKNVEQAEIMKCFMDICQNINNAMPKNSPRGISK